jgi:putative SOS response-associated peptidase YedK
MCGRFTLTTPTDELASHFEAPDPPPLTARYNVAPSQVIAVVGLKPDGRRRGIALLRWGLVPMGCP